ncbi:MAG: T9SS type A sorting domain-containing protein [Crocinitomicaceae bacterium]
MRGLSVALLLATINFNAFCKDADCSGEVYRSNKTILQCGENTERGFEGWMVNGLTTDMNLYFEHQQIEVFSHQAKNVNFSITKKIDEMVGYTDLTIIADLASIENCDIHSATAYVSPDGKKWTALNQDLTKKAATSFNEKMNHLYLRIVTQISFFSEGRFKVKGMKLTGTYRPNASPVKEMAQVLNGPAAVQMKEAFHIFQFENQINIETKNEKEYDFILMSINGKILQQEKTSGSKRFEVAVPSGIYFVSILQDNKPIITKKVAL